jgi:tRNA uridine 5-carboxymethylaminomethyl modification enzyme
LFTSRAEYRLLLREDNADLRLQEIGRELGLVDERTYTRFLAKKEAIAAGIRLLHETKVKPTQEVNDRLAGLGSAPMKQAGSLADILRRPEICLDDLFALAEIKMELSADFKQDVQLQVKYEGYISRQIEQVERFKKLEDVLLPDDIDYSAFDGLSNEVVEKLRFIRPRSLGQASRISGVTPAALSVLQVYLKKKNLI